MSVQRPGEPRRQLRLTRLGAHFLFVGAFAILGGALRGFNLLLVLAGLIVGALLVQWRWSLRSIESMDVKRRMPTEAFAGRPFRLRYRLRNLSRFVPVWMICVEDRIASLDGDVTADAVCGVGMLAAGSTILTPCDCTILRRGRYRFGPVKLMTAFPFLLFNSQKTVDSTIEFHVFPKILSLHGRWRERLFTRSGGVSATARRSGQVEGEFFGLREWQSGDSPKWIHWRTTARLNELAVRQFEQQRRFELCFLVDAFAASEADCEKTERAISLAATFVIHLASSPANQLVLAVAGRASEAVMGGGSDLGKRRMLGILSDVQSTTHPQLAEATGKATQIVGYVQDLVVLSPRSMRETFASDPKSAKTMSPWLRRGSLRWIDVSTEFDRWVVSSAAASELDFFARRRGERPEPLMETH